MVVKIESGSDLDKGGKIGDHGDLRGLLRLASVRPHGLLTPPIYQQRPRLLNPEP